MLELLWWHWAVLGFVLIVAELVLPSFVIVWFGLGGFLVAMALGLMPDLSLAVQLLIWTLSSIGMTFLWFRVFKPSHHKSLIGRASAQLVGEVGMVVIEVAPFKAGRVRFQKPLVGSDIWDCRADETLESGTRVKVESVDGNVVTVKKVEG